MVFSDVTRKQAFWSHLAVSVCIFFLISYLIIFRWFPEFYFYLDGGIRAITTIFFVDVVLGPGLTLLVFKPGKKSLKFDMAVILLLQLSALSWGVSSVYSERSGASIFYYGKFSCIAHDDTDDMDMSLIAAGTSGSQRLSFLQRPDTIDKFMSFTKEAYDHLSSEIYYYPEKIVPLDGAVVKRLQNYKLSMSELASENKEMADMAEDYLERHGDKAEHLQLMPLSCRYGSAIAVYDVRELKIIDWFKMKTQLRGKAQDEPLPLSSEVQD